MTMRQNKTLSLFAMSIFAVVVLMSFASAVSLSAITPINVPSSVSQNAGSFQITFNLTNTGLAGNIYDLTNFTSTQTGLSSSFNDLVMADGSGTPVTETITATISFASGQTGTIAGNINVGNDNVTTDVTFPFSVSLIEDLPTEIASCKAVGMPSSETDVRIKKIDLKNNGMEIASSTGTTVTFGEDEKWFPFENIEAQIEVKNYGSYDADNVEISWGVWDTDSNSWVIEPDNEKDFKLDNGDTESITVEFSIDDNVDMDLEDLRDGSHYQFYAYLSDGVVDDSDSPDDGLSFCAYDSQSTEMVIESNFVILNNVNLPESIQCGQNVEVTSDVWNIGDRDQDSVSVEIYDKTGSLKISKEVSVGDLNAFDNQKISFSFQVPEGTTEGSYALVMNVLDEDGDVYQTDFDDDDSSYTIPFTVESCGPAQPDTTISASLVSGGKAGKDLVVRATITNTGSDLKTYAVSAAGFAEWASASSVDQSTLVLNPGQSRDVTFTFPVLKSASGEQIFYIETVSGTEVTRQPVSVSIEPSSFLGLTGNSIFGSNGTLWLIGLLNVILIIVIIIVAIRVARR